VATGTGLLCGLADLWLTSPQQRPASTRQDRLHERLIRTSVRRLSVFSTTEGLVRGEGSSRSPARSGSGLHPVLTGLAHQPGKPSFRDEEQHASIGDHEVGLAILYQEPHEAVVLALDAAIDRVLPVAARRIAGTLCPSCLVA
jgi:hypothetical protein